MRTIPSHDPEVMEKRSGGGGMAVFGFVFLCIGIAIAAMALGVIPAEDEGGPPRFVGAMFGLPFAITGLIFALGRSGLIVDKRTGVLTKWHGLIVPIIRKEKRIDFYERVTIGKEKRSSGKNQITVYPVRLEGSKGEAPLELSAAQDYLAARREAEEMAKFMGWELADASSGTVVTREADKLDESVRERVRRTGETPEPVPLPPQMRIRVERTGADLNIFTPAPGLGIPEYLLMTLGVMGTFMGGAMFLFVFIDETAPLPIKIFFSLFMIVPIAVSWSISLGRARKKYEIFVSYDRLRVKTRGFIFSSESSMPMSEMEELVFHSGLAMPSPEELARRSGKSGQEVPPIVYTFLRILAKPGLVARSDKAEIKFGEGLSDEELKYVHYEIMRMIAE